MFSGMYYMDDGMHEHKWVVATVGFVCCDRTQSTQHMRNRFTTSFMLLVHTTRGETLGSFSRSAITAARLV